MPKVAYKNQQGFSALLAVLMVAIVIGICLVGWFVLRADTKPQPSANNSAATQPAPPPASQSTQPDPSEGGKYLVIREWGVRFQLPAELRGDIYYVADQYDANIKIIDSKHFPQGAQCVSFGLVRTKEPVNNPLDPNGFNTSSFERIKGFYFARQVGVIACSDKDEVHAEAAAVQRQLYDAAQSLELLP